MIFKEFLKQFPDDNVEIEYFIKTRYSQGEKCPHYGSDKVSHGKDYPKLFQCNTCINSFSIFKDTIFEKKTTDLTKFQIFMLFDKIVKYQKNIVITDEFRSYERHANLTYIIQFQKDHRLTHADGDIHTNTIESFWTIIKRSVYGIYHRISVKYMQAYINEMNLRRNHREIDSSFDLVLRNAILS